MDDLISRQAAIDALHTKFRDGFDEDKWWNSTHVLAAIESIPAADVAPVVHGEWERIPYSFVGGYRCSRCGQKTMENFWLYCPNCGAKMEE